MNVDNPYQPPTTEQCLDERLVFDGVIHESDYFDLLAPSGLARFGWIVFESPLLTLIVPGILATSAYERWQGYAWQLPVTCLTFLILAAGLFFLQRTSSRRAIVQRELQRNPDLLGTARGELTADGFLFYDGVHHYWFGPYLLANCFVTSRGIRIQTDATPYRYLALTRRLFHHYDPAVARRLVRMWIRLAVSAHLPSHTLWIQLGEAPSDAIHFNFETLDVARRPRIAEQHSLGIKDAIAHLFMVMGMVATWRSIGLWLFMGYLAVLLFTFALVSVRQRWASKHPPPTITQHNWLTPIELASYNSHAGMRVPIEQLQLTVQSDQLIVGTLHGQPLEIERSMLIDPSQWKQLCALAAK